jgi:hypothetical protein
MYGYTLIDMMSIIHIQKGKIMSAILEDKICFGRNIQPTSSSPIPPSESDFEYINSAHTSIKPTSQSIEESKKIMTNFQKGIANYPKYMSYEGSMVLCVMLSMKSPALVQLENLPLVDQQTILGLVKGSSIVNVTSTSYFDVTFDEIKDFIITFTAYGDSKVTEKFNMFNTVAHPRCDDLKDSGIGEVPVENDGDTIKVGDKIVVDKRVMRTIMKIPVKNSQQINNHETLKQQDIPRSVNKNAYEIRESILGYAIDVAKLNNLLDVDQILNIANKFYKFVENKK